MQRGGVCRKVATNWRERETRRDWGISESNALKEERAQGYLFPIDYLYFIFFVVQPGRLLFRMKLKTLLDFRSKLLLIFIFSQSFFFFFLYFDNRHSLRAIPFNCLVKNVSRMSRGVINIDYVMGKKPERSGEMVCAAFWGGFTPALFCSSLMNFKWTFSLK